MTTNYETIPGLLWIVIRLAIGILATYRVAHMVATETGPFAVFANIRQKVLSWFGKGWLSEGFFCPLCISFWASLASTFLLFHGTAVGMFLMLWLCIAGGVMMLHFKVYQAI